MKVTSQDLTGNKYHDQFKRTYNHPSYHTRVSYLWHAPLQEQEISFSTVAAPPRTESRYDDYETIRGYALLRLTHIQARTELTNVASAKERHPSTSAKVGVTSQRALTKAQPEAGRGVCQAEASRYSASTWLRTLLLFKTNCEECSSSFLFFALKEGISFHKPWLQLCQFNNASMSVILNQLHFFPVPEEELIFSRSLHGHSCNRLHMRT